MNDAANETPGAAAPKPWFLYLLECAGGRIYTGITVDVDARYAAHVAGKGARFTRAYPPSRILLSLSFADRSAASRAEYRIKQLSASQKRGLIAGTYVCDLTDLCGSVHAGSEGKAGEKYEKYEERAPDTGTTGVRAPGAPDE
ncbi:GIY-YIG nuclease family protein [Pandoraea anhela]|uniref:GIY-YIG nuclease superfamily protein n=1 Tax=Pandoraea anhela TaxID=2508295 RepID=A0A5E4UQF3_9BURK|nr:GIY-YIG nuclease family protein [Pandoraea anhela]VVE00600.1 GIY-YIG nuclease superfamily protein [Pandoraea anhela]